MGAPQSVPPSNFKVDTEYWELEGVDEGGEAVHPAHRAKAAAQVKAMMGFVCMVGPPRTIKKFIKSTSWCS